MAVRREPRVAVENPGRDLERRAIGTARSLDDVRAGLGKGSDELEACLAHLFSAARDGDVDLQHAVTHDRCPLENVTPLIADALDMREEMELRLLRNPVRLEHRGAEPVELQNPRFRARHAAAALVRIPARLGQGRCPIP